MVNAKPQPIPTDREIVRRADLFKMAADATRLKILYLLSGGGLNVGQVSKALGLSMPSTSVHLALLRVSSMAESRREGKNRFYTLTALGRTVTSLFQSK